MEMGNEGEGGGEGRTGQLGEYQMRGGPGLGNRILPCFFLFVFGVYGSIRMNILDVYGRGSGV